eukprot:545009-Pyramimonas_sp.AAC.1
MIYYAKHYFYHVASSWFISHGRLGWPHGASGCQNESESCKAGPRAQTCRSFAHCRSERARRMLRPKRPL